MAAPEPLFSENTEDEFERRRIQSRVKESKRKTARHQNTRQKIKKVPLLGRRFRTTAAFTEATCKSDLAFLPPPPLPSHTMGLAALVSADLTVVTQ